MAEKAFKPHPWLAEAIEFSENEWDSQPEIVKSKFLNLSVLVDESNKAMAEIDHTKLPKYHISYLNDSAIGMTPSELVVIGADTGQGKTHIANHIAKKNAENGLKVYLFSLEGHKYEVINRWKWEIICREYYKEPDGKEMVYQKFEMNMIHGIEDLIKIASDEIKKLSGNIKIFDKSVQLDKNVLIEQISTATDADLIIIDHLHYFNLLNERSEMEGLSEIVRVIKDMTDKHKIPIVLVSHLRKKEKKRGLPDNEDFMGSSNIAKIASTCILLSSNPDNHDLTSGRYSTIMRISKSRAGASTTLAGEIFFNSRENKYENVYSLGKVINGTYKELDPNEYPDWANVPEVII